METTERITQKIFRFDVSETQSKIKSKGRPKNITAERNDLPTSQQPTSAPSFSSICGTIILQKPNLLGLFFYYCVN
jgi:hypothetical protein